jgi:membrane-bound lytic murein transglycosylase C
MRNTRPFTVVAGRILRMASCSVLLLAPSLGAQGGDGSVDPRRKMLEQIRKSRQRMRRDVAAGMQAQADEFSKLSANMQAQYDELDRKMRAQREWLRSRVEKQWDAFHESTNKEWVDYGEPGDSMSRVDFEKGKVDIEVLVPVWEATSGRRKEARFSELSDAEKDRLKTLAEEKIVRQARKALSQKEEGKAEVLQGQIRAPDGRPVTRSNAGRFVKESLAPKAEASDKPVVAKDGVPRIKVAVSVDMVPEHLRVRAQRYASQVASAARRFDLEPALIYAVIHTESFFNPMARSDAGAFGLMQLVPRTGAGEAYKFLYKEEKLLTPDYLYDPDNNILLGSAYLGMLHTLYYGKLKDPANRRTLSVAAYNCGPGNVRKRISSAHDVDSLPPAKVVELVRALAPKETQAYVPKVLERIETYRKM